MDNGTLFWKAREPQPLFSPHGMFPWIWYEAGIHLWLAILPETALGPGGPWVALAYCVAGQAWGKVGTHSWEEEVVWEEVAREAPSRGWQVSPFLMAAQGELAPTCSSGLQSFFAKLLGGTLGFWHNPHFPSQTLSPVLFPQPNTVDLCCRKDVDVSV